MPETLQALISRRLGELGLTYRAAAEPTRVRGQISVGSFHAYGIGKRSNPSEKAIRGIALAIDVPVDEVAAALSLPPALARFTLPKKADRLTAAERQIVLGMVDALLAAHSDGRAARPARRATG